LLKLYNAKNISRRNPSKQTRRKMKRILSICCMGVAVVLMSLPYGVQMRFVSDPGPPMEFVSFYYSYFSGMPIGYANWFPIITVLLSIAVLLMLVVRAVRHKSKNSCTVKPLMICLVICVVASLCSWLIFNAVSVIGVVVFALHLATLALQINYRKTKEV
jgi:uncharacterized membrane protein